MRAGVVFFGLQCKKYGKLLPAILGKSLIFAAVMGMFAVVAVKMLSAESAFSEITVAVVSEEDDSVTDMLVGFVGAMDSFEESVSFERMSEEQAGKALEKREVYAAIYLPAGVLEGILNGNNIPAKVVLSRAGSEMETAVFEAVAKAGGRMLSIAQAGIYAADELCLETDRKENIREAEDYLNNAYLEYALNRTAIFELEEVTAVGKVRLQTYYTLSVMIAFLTFAGVVMGRYAKVTPDALTSVLSASGLGWGRQYLLDTIAFSLVFAVAGTALGCPVLVFCAVTEGRKSAVALVLISFMSVLCFLGIFFRLILGITGSGNMGLGCAVVLLLAMMFLGGMFIPSVFLPVWAERIGGVLPYHDVLEILVCSFQGEVESVDVIGLVSGAVIGLLSGAGIFFVRGKKAIREADVQ